MTLIGLTRASKYLRRYNRIFKTLLREVHKNADGDKNMKLKSTLYYVTAAGVLAGGLSYAAVPLYRMFCQAYSYGGTTAAGHDIGKVETMSALKHRPITIKFNADIASSMRWNFKPQQNEITVCKIKIIDLLQVRLTFQVDMKLHDYCDSSFHRWFLVKLL